MAASHANCNHPNTKSARAKCRRTNVVPSLKRFAADQLGWDITTLRLDEDNAQELRETIAQATGLDYPTRIALEKEIGQYLLHQPAEPTIVTDADEVKNLRDEVEQTRAEQVGQEVTAENWREFKGRTIEIELEVWGAQPNHKATGQIIAWGAQYMTYAVPFYGTSNRVKTERVVRAICVK